MKKWAFTVQLLNSNLLHFSWTSEEKDEKKDETPGPITDRTTAPSTSFGIQPSGPNYVHKRATIK